MSDSGPLRDAIEPLYVAFSQYRLASELSLAITVMVLRMIDYFGPNNCANWECKNFIIILGTR